MVSTNASKWLFNKFNFSDASKNIYIYIEQNWKNLTAAY